MLCRRVCPDTARAVSAVRRLVYDHREMREPPQRGLGTLRWLREVLPSLEGGEGQGRRPYQCMQGPGDLIYVPEGTHSNALSS